MKTTLHIIAGAVIALMSGIGVNVAAQNPGLGTRVDYINSEGQRFWSKTIDNSTGQSLFHLEHFEQGWIVWTDQSYDEGSYANSIKFVPWGTESYNIVFDTDIPTEYYVKPSGNQKPHRIKANAGVNVYVQCGDTVTLVMALPDKAYPSIDFLYRYTCEIPSYTGEIPEERWQETTAAPFLNYVGKSRVYNPKLLTDADKLDEYLSPYINGSPSYTRLPDTENCKNRWEYEFIMPNEPLKIRIGYDYVDAKVLTNSVLSTLYSTLYTQFGEVDFNGNSGENWTMRYFGDGMSQDQVNNLAIYETGFTSLSYLNKANFVTSAIPWADYYCGIILSDMILDHLDVFDKATETERNIAKAQLLSLRAHCYTRIMQVYGKRWQDSDEGAALCAPLILSYKDIQKPLSTMNDIRKQIYKDLDQAIQIFESVNFNRVDILQPDLNVARGLKMRVALLTEDWIAAKDMAQLILADVPLSSNADMMSGFYKRRDSWIWGASSNAVYDKLQTQIYYWSPQNYNSCNGTYTTFTHWNIGPSAIDRDLWLQIPENDIRRSLFAMPEMLTNATMNNLDNWYNPDYMMITNRLFFCLNNREENASKIVVKQYNASRPEANAFRYGSKEEGYSYVPIPFGAQLKFWSTGDSYGYNYLDCNGDDATLFMRSDEALLTQAEACYMLGDEATAKALVNKLNTMRNCDASASSGQKLLDEIRFTRRIELWGEGFGFFDQKRWNLPAKRNIWKEGDTGSGNWPIRQAAAADVATSAANGWRAPIPAYYVKQNPNIDISMMGYADVTGYTTDESVPESKAPESNLRAVSEEIQTSIDTSVTF